MVVVEQKQALCEIIFTYDQESNESVCTIRNKDKECGARVKGKDPTILHFM